MNTWLISLIKSKKNCILIELDGMVSMLICTVQPTLEYVDFICLDIKKYKKNIDLHTNLDEVYICKIIELLFDSLPIYLENEPVEKNQNSNICIVICMSKESSHQLLRAQYFQSDIDFKYIVSFYEFELAYFDYDANTSMTTFSYMLA